jgi:hypothetical protein
MPTMQTIARPTMTFPAGIPIPIEQGTPVECGSRRYNEQAGEHRVRRLMAHGFPNTVAFDSSSGPVEFTLWWRKPSSSCILEPSPDAGLAKISERLNKSWMPWDLRPVRPAATVHV